MGLGTIHELIRISGVIVVRSTLAQKRILRNARRFPGVGEGNDRLAHATDGGWRLAGLRDVGDVQGVAEGG